MSLLGKLGGALKGGIKGFVSGGPAGAAMGALGGLARGQTRAPPESRGGLANLPTTNRLSASNVVAQAIPLAKSSGAYLLRNAGKIGGAVATGAVIYDAVGNIIGHRQRKRRRMNPLNGRAAMRAIRRIKGARKMLQRIERQLPKQRTSRSPSSGSRSVRQEFIRQG